MLKLYLERFRQNKLAVVGGLFIVLLAAVALFAPWLCPRDPLMQNLLERLQGPRADSASADRAGRAKERRARSSNKTINRRSPAALFRRSR